MDLSKFKSYEFVPGVATVTFAKHGMGFSKKAIHELGNPDFVRLLINAEDKQLALVVAQEGEDGAIKCMKGKTPDDNRNFRIVAKDLLHKVAHMMNCQHIDDLSCKVVGEFFDDGNVMLIDLKRARKTGESDNDGSEEQNT